MNILIYVYVYIYICMYHTNTNMKNKVKEAHIKMIGTLKNNKGIASQLMILDTKGIIYDLSQLIIKYVKKLYESVYKKNKIKLPTNSANIYYTIF